MTQTWILDLAVYVTAITTIVGGVWAFARFVIPPTKRALSLVYEMEDVVKEFKPNGGSSLKDIVTKIHTEMVSMRADVRRTEAKQWAIVSSMQYPVWEFNLMGKCIRVNSPMLKLVNSTESDFLGSSWLSLIYSADREAVRKEWEMCVHDKRAMKMAYRIKSHTGQVFYVESTRMPFFDDEDNVLGWLGIWENVRSV